VPLRIYHDRYTPEASHGDGLQLFNLPALWGALGLLQGKGRSSPWYARLDVIVSLGKAEYSLRSVSTLRLCHSLGGSKEFGLRSGRR
jgi:hypothetical protein